MIWRCQLCLIYCYCMLIDFSRYANYYASSYVRWSVWCKSWFDYVSVCVNLVWLLCVNVTWMKWVCVCKWYVDYVFVDMFIAGLVVHAWSEDMPRSWLRHENWGKAMIKVTSWRYLGDLKVFGGISYEEKLQRV